MSDMSYDSLLAAYEEMRRFYDEHKDLWHCTMEDHEASVAFNKSLHDRSEAAERERDEARQALERLGHHGAAEAQGVTNDYFTLRAEAAEQEVKRLREAAQALYERVEMDESVGICLSSRVEALNLIAALGSESEVSAWLAYICSVQGHVVNGLGYGTNAEAVVWDNHCSRCGVKLRGSESE